MKNMSDVYYSRLLAIARQNKGIRFIRNIENNQILVELDNGNISTLPFEEVINYKNSDEKNVETI